MIKLITMAHCGIIWSKIYLHLKFTHSEAKKTGGAIIRAAVITRTNTVHVTWERHRTLCVTLCYTII